MGSGKMPLVTAIIASICIIIYISAIVFGAVQITLSINSRRVLADREFDDLADRASAASAALGFMTDAYRLSIMDEIEDSQTILGAIISGSNGQFGFEKRKDSVISWVGDSPRFKPGFGLPNDPFHRVISISGQRNGTIQAQYSLIDYDVLLNALKNTLTVILGSLALAVFALIIELSLKKNARYYGAGARKNPSPQPHYREAADPVPKRPVQRTAEESPADADINPGEEEESGDPFFEESSGKEPEIPQDAAPQRKPEPAKPAPPVLEAAHVPETESKPRGLYSPRSNVGWESYTKERLASELHRCASAEQDLAVICIGSGGKADEARRRRLADETVKFFAQRDLIFEKGESGFSVILPGVDLEQGIAKSEEFIKRVKAKFPGSFDEGLFIGLSSRAGRLVEADRVLFESSGALKKAAEDPASPIIGFKSDLEKYRKFISRR